MPTTPTRKATLHQLVKRNVGRLLMATFASSLILAGTASGAALAQTSAASADEPGNVSAAGLVPQLRHSEHRYSTYTEDPATWTDAITIARLDIVRTTSNLQRTPVAPWTSDSPADYRAVVSARSCTTGKSVAFTTTPITFGRTLNKKTLVGTFTNVRIALEPRILEAARQADIALSAYLMYPQTPVHYVPVVIAGRPCSTGELNPGAPIGWVKSDMSGLLYNEDPSTWTDSLRIARLTMFAEQRDLARTRMAPWKTKKTAQLRYHVVVSTCADGTFLGETTSAWVTPKQARNAKTKTLTFTNVNIPFTLPDDVLAASQNPGNYVSVRLHVAEGTDPHRAYEIAYAGCNPAT